MECQFFDEMSDIIWIFFWNRKQPVDDTGIKNKLRPLILNSHETGLIIAITYVPV